ncbi:hypothetical protein GYA13_02880 [Candidatus Kuenenbacteria bacterium]|nr:hypothetical protein [Candidatus Kuenenbacteria bacterium]
MPITLAYFYGLITFFGLQLGVINPIFFWWAAGGLLIFNIFFVWLATRAKWDKNFFNFLISPFFFLLSGLMFLGFANQLFIRELAIVFLSVGATLFVRQLIILSYHKYRYQNHSLSTISKILNTTTIFFWFNGVFDLLIFLNISFWLLAPLTVLEVYLVTYQFFIINKIKNVAGQWFLPVITLAITELFLVVSWLPNLSAVKALIMTAAYYFFTGLAQHFLLGTINKKTYWRYGAALILIWLIVLATARWS